MKNLKLLLSIGISILLTAGGMAKSAESRQQYKYLSIGLSDDEKLVKFYEYRKKRGFIGVKIVGFDVGGSRSITGMEPKNSYDAPEIYQAAFTENTDGGKIVFYTSTKCEITYTDRNRTLVDRIIEVNGQKIQSTYACTGDNSSSSGTAQLFVPKNAEANTFLIREFIKKNYVFAKFEDIEIPFSAKGFTALWESSDSSAL